MEAIAGGAGAEKIEVLDLTRACSRRYSSPGNETELVILGVPVYTGRVPFQAVEALQHMEDKGTPAVIVVVYGNRAYEDALLELNDIARRIGFVPIAGAAFVGEHSFSTTETPIAVGRPDQEDLEKALAFGRMVREKLDAMESQPVSRFLKIPGNYPYRERTQHIASPQTVVSLCTRCGTCKEICPEDAITISDSGVTSDEDRCILCCACIKACPNGARHMDDQELLQIAEELSSTCREGKLPEAFI